MGSFDILKIVKCWDFYLLINEKAILNVHLYNVQLFLRFFKLT